MSDDRNDRTVPGRDEDDLRILALLLGDLDDGASARLREHIAASPHLSRRRKDLERLLGRLRTARSRRSLRDLEPRLHRRLVRLFRSRPVASAAAGRVGDAVRLVTGRLAFDSGRGDFARLGYRGYSDARHLVFATEDHEVDLQLTRLDAPRDDRFAMIGQVEPLEVPSGTEVTVVRLDGVSGSGEGAWSVPIDSEGVFEGEFGIAACYEIAIPLESGYLVIPRVGLTEDVEPADKAGREPGSGRDEAG